MPDMVAGHTRRRSSLSTRHAASLQASGRIQYMKDTEAKAQKRAVNLPRQPGADDDNLAPRQLRELGEHLTQEDQTRFARSHVLQAGPTHGDVALDKEPRPFAPVPHQLAHRLLEAAVSGAAVVVVPVAVITLLLPTQEPITANRRAH